VRTIHTRVIVTARTRARAIDRRRDARATRTFSRGD
jgi:hypothetical protein